MKKFIIIAIIALTAGSITSCTKENVKPSKTVTADKTDTGSGDLTSGGLTTNDKTDTGSGDGAGGGLTVSDKTDTGSGDLTSGGNQ